jgi:hypothetical protein
MRVPLAALQERDAALSESFARSRLERRHPAPREPLRSRAPEHPQAQQPRQERSHAAPAALGRRTTSHRKERRRRFASERPQRPKVTPPPVVRPTVSSVAALASALAAALHCHESAARACAWRSLAAVRRSPGAQRSRPRAARHRSSTPERRPRRRCRVRRGPDSPSYATNHRMRAPGGGSPRHHETATSPEMAGPIRGIFHYHRKKHAGVPTNQTRVEHPASGASRRGPSRRAGARTRRST